MSLFKLLKRPVSQFNFNPNIIQRPKINLRTFATQVEQKDLLINKLEGSQEGITVFSLNRPQVKNALSKSLVYSLLEGIANLENDASTRVLILRSNVPGIFCAGADLKERVSMTDEEVKAFVTGLRTMMTSIENIKIPVIAALDGTAMGGGLEMALACDIRIAADIIKMGLVETKLAIIPGAGGTQRLPRIISPAIAKELIFTARLINGTEAKDLGVVNHAVQQSETKDAAYKMALKIAEEILHNGPIALRMAKQAIDEGIQVPLSEGYKVEQKCYEGVLYSKDRIEGLKAFNEKRKPRYLGN